MSLSKETFHMLRYGCSAKGLVNTVGIDYARAEKLLSDWQDTSFKRYADGAVVLARQRDAKPPPTFGVPYGLGVCYADLSYYPRHPLAITKVAEAVGTNSIDLVQHQFNWELKRMGQ